MLTIKQHLHRVGHIKLKGYMYFVSNICSPQIIMHKLLR